MYAYVRINVMYQVRTELRTEACLYGSDGTVLCWHAMQPNAMLCDVVLCMHWVKQYSMIHAKNKTFLLVILRCTVHSQGLLDHSGKDL